MTWALLFGYAIGSIPSADALARLKGHNLRAAGSGNPGTANALRVAGRGVAFAILLVDLFKGAVASLAGGALAGPAGVAGGGVAAVAGQVLNPWFGFRGGKGIGVTAGMTAVAWPFGLLVVLPFMSVGAKVVRAAAGAVIGLGAYLAGAALWAANDWPVGWGIDPDDRLVWMAIGVVFITAPKFLSDLTRRRG